MARYLYGGTAADVTTTRSGQLVTGATLTVWDSQSGGTQITDLQDASGAATTVVKSDDYGRILFYGPDADTRSFWLESNVGGRVLVRPAASIMPADGSISNVHVNAAAAIARSKIAGLPTSSTDNTLPRFDGTTGALQGSGVTVDDNNNVETTGSLRAAKSTVCAVTALSTGSEAYVQAAGTSAWLRLRTTAEVDRFAVFATGDEFRIRRFDGAGGFLADTVKIERTTGRTTFNEGTTFNEVGAAAGIELGSGGPRIMTGTGSPEGVVTAPVGSIWLNQSGGASTTLYVKTSGTGDTGWTAK